MYSKNNVSWWNAREQTKKSINRKMILCWRNKEGCKAREPTKNVINPKIAPNNHEHTNSTHHVETVTPTLTNNCLQLKPTH